MTMTADSERVVPDIARENELRAIGIEATVAWTPDDRVTVTMRTSSLDVLINNGTRASKKELDDAETTGYEIGHDEGYSEGENDGVAEGRRLAIEQCVEALNEAGRFIGAAEVLGELR